MNQLALIGGQLENPMYGLVAGGLHNESLCSCRPSGSHTCPSASTGHTQHYQTDHIVAHSVHLHSATVHQCPVHEFLKRVSSTFIYIYFFIFHLLMSASLMTQNVFCFFQHQVRTFSCFSLLKLVFMNDCRAHLMLKMPQLLRMRE